jgi:membrane-bound acyltransferase YfiQ involved in biofilm formation
MFTNYESSKLLLAEPGFNNLLLMGIMVLLAGITVSSEKSNFFDFKQTEQLKGAAIILVVIGHLWTHVSSVNVEFNFAGYSVALFLLLSGYGLAISWEKKTLNFKEYVRRRISRVMIPYWIITVLILVLDYFLLNKTYSGQSIIFTFLGINFEKSLRHLDYARWFVTLILLYYCIFYVAVSFLKNHYRIGALFCFALVLFILRRIEIFPFGNLYYFLAFPTGCFIAFYKNRAASFLFKRKTPIYILLLSGIGFTICRYLSAHGTDINMHKLLVFSVKNTEPLFFCSFLVSITAILGIFSLKSRFLAFCGSISYEIYLLHGAVLIKYNPVFHFFSSEQIIPGFIFVMVLIIILSIFLKKLQQVPILLPKPGLIYKNDPKK